MKTIKTIVVLAIMAIATTQKTHAQISFGTGAVVPAPSGGSFYLWDNNKAMVPNQVSLTSTTDATTVTPSPPTGGLVYNLSTTGSGTTAVTPGYYYWTGSRWDRFVTGPLFQSVESTGSVTATTSWQIIPGATLTSNYLAGDIVSIHYSGNFAYSSGGFGAYAIIDAVPYVNNVMLAIGGFVRAEVNLDYSSWVPYGSTAVYVIPTTGSYTFDLRTRSAAGTAGIIVGGNSASAAECVFTITTYRR
ncbi:MAG TPA: hypothetical protein PKZ56_02190 [Candidatus Paceibacterota bacterium]|nr:hypothetical protein [Candidatus Paceibacterota bacterium]